MVNFMSKQKSVVQNAPATMVFIAINIIIFIALNTIPGLSEQLLLNPELYMIQQRPWTLVTVFFSQEIHIHLLLNMGLFFVFGRELERNTGSTAVLSTYMICGFLGSVTIPFLAPVIGWTTGLVAGASAAVWGVVAAVAVLQPNTRFRGYTAMHYTMGLFAGNAMLFIFNPSVSIGAAAHAAGIFAGLACGYGFKKRKASKK
ncbi:rhomboid family intramembrane serine protease [Tindallia californiensis]|uniref:Membrane associated serine protease, rhomboid family n=1 Tax=Tindallia californiensis TaxID=159292 RepID=A0A1H3QP88_9FIRM|nr:rhomboid family intramembrane serine protease [Tindallia californiensis]SDZ15103.1 Membrane associated serine protease, rhomboid family [Tindallia californiensis]